MDTKEKQKIMYDRFLSLTKEEKTSMCDLAEYVDSRYAWDHTKQNDNDITPSECHTEMYIQHWWEKCIVGEQYTKFKRKAEYWLKNPQKFYDLLETVQKKKRWGTLRGYRLKDKELNLFTVMCFLKGLECRKQAKALWLCYKNEPKFKTGDIVKFRSNAGVDAVLQKHTWSGHSTYYGCGRNELAKAKTKTYMIIEVDAELDANSYAKTYAYHEKQGGCRYYKVLPMGEAKTYFVVEKFLKKFRMPK